MNNELKRPVLVTYIFCADCPWINEKRQRICRTYADLADINQLCKTQPNKFKIVEVRELPC